MYEDMVVKSLDEAFSVLPYIFNAGQAKDYHVTYHFVLHPGEYDEEESPTHFYVRVDDGKVVVLKNPAEPPPAQVTIKMSGPDYLRLVNGVADVIGLYIGHRIDITGEITYLEKFRDFFKTEIV